MVTIAGGILLAMAVVVALPYLFMALWGVALLGLAAIGVMIYYAGEAAITGSLDAQGYITLLLILSCALAVVLGMIANARVEAKLADERRKAKKAREQADSWTLDIPPL